MFRNILMAITLASTSAFAIDPAMVEVAQITSSQMDPQLMGRYKAGPGTLTIDLVERTVDLHIARVKDCPPSAFCTAEMPAPVMVKLPIVSVETEKNGVRVIRAFADNRPADGELEEIIIRDNREYVGKAVLASTSITYSTKAWSRMTRDEITTYSTMIGSALEEIRPVTCLF